MGNWYKRQRSIPERPWFKDGAVVQVFDYLDAIAYVVDGTYKDMIIRQGSCPTTRADIVEVTGLSYKTVDRCLKKLVACGDIIVKGNNFGSVITICNYGGYGNNDSLFGTTEDTANDTANYTANYTAGDTTHLSNTDNRYKDILITPFSPYKKEKEGDLALEAKKRYNKTFDGKLPPCSRLTMPTRMMVMECISRFGMQSVDMVFSQVLAEPFSLGQNKTGFIASFQYIFTPKRFQEYLERAQLRLKKATTPVASAADIPQSVGVIEVAGEGQATKLQDEYERNMREYAAQHPDSRQARIVAEWDKQKDKSQACCCATATIKK